MHKAVVACLPVGLDTLRLSNDQSRLSWKHGPFCRGFERGLAKDMKREEHGWSKRKHILRKGQKNQTIRNTENTRKTRKPQEKIKKTKNPQKKNHKKTPKHSILDQTSSKVTEHGKPPTTNAHSNTFDTTARNSLHGNEPTDILLD